MDVRANKGIKSVRVVWVVRLLWVVRLVRGVTIFFKIFKKILKFSKYKK